MCVAIDMGWKQYIQISDSECDGTSYVRVGPAMGMGHVMPPDGGAPAISAGSAGYFQGRPPVGGTQGWFVCSVI